MRRFLVALSAATTLLSPSAFAERGEITIVGQGLASASPEFTRFQVDVTSICYDTSRAAKEANAVLANQILTVLKSFATGPADKVLATGGVNIIRTEVTYVGSEPRVICEMKWRATNTLILESATIDQIPDIQDQVLAAVDAQAADPALVAQTFAELAQPSFHVYDATLKALKQAAHTAAYDDARLQYDAFHSRCQFQDSQLASISPPEYAVYGRKAGDAISDAPSSTPIIPDDIAVNATWTFVWTFAQAASCPQ